jgi:hypothetical protein
LCDELGRRQVAERAVWPALIVVDSPPFDLGLGVGNRRELVHLILFGERRLMRVLDEFVAHYQFVAHYHGERNHQGLDNDLIAPDPRRNDGVHVCCRQRLGGMLRYYHRAA